jgi:hypothetical protein
MRKLKAETKKNLLIVMQFIRIISEIKLKKFSWNDKFGSQLLSAILAPADSTEPFPD